MPLNRPTAPSRHALAVPHVCILGGGFGGLYCALALQRYQTRASQPLRITLVEPRDRFLFTPLLYELLTDELKPWEIAPAYTSLLGTTSIHWCQDWATAIDLQQRRVHLRQGSELNYDYLVVALGSRLRPPTVPGSERALPFATLEDVWQLEQRLLALEREARAVPIHVVVAGAGPSGVELACKLTDRLQGRGRITVLDRRAVILRSYPEPMQRAAARAMAKRQIQVITEAPIEAVQAHQVTYHHQGQTHCLPVDLVIWTVGTVPQPWLGQAPKQSPLAQCLVRPTLQLLDDDQVFVLGDMAQMPAPGRDRAPMTAQAAFQAAPRVAHNLWALVCDRPLRPYRYHHLGDMLTLGQGAAVVYGFGLCITGPLAAWARRWAYWLRLPTHAHRWQVLKHWLPWRKP